MLGVYGNEDECWAPASPFFMVTGQRLLPSFTVAWKNCAMDLPSKCPGICKVLSQSRPPGILVEENGGQWKGSGASDKRLWFLTGACLASGRPPQMSRQRGQRSGVCCSRHAQSCTCVCAGVAGALSPGSMRPAGQPPEGGQSASSAPCSALTYLFPKSGAFLTFLFASSRSAMPSPSGSKP